MATILDKIKYPSDLRNLSTSQLSEVAEALRAETIHIASQTGGHLGAGLGVIELTVALHYVFDTPKDKIIWDIGHQCYPHKILTGRRKDMPSLRQGGGLSGFLKRSESEYDHFGAGHSSTSISAALGFAVARDQQGLDHNIIAVIGDGSLSAGLAYEGLNNVGELKSPMIVILNDNQMSIAPAVGAMSRYLSKMITSSPYLKAKQIAKSMLKAIPGPLDKIASKAEQFAKENFSAAFSDIQDSAASSYTSGNFFENLGFNYIGVVDGHDVDLLTEILSNIKKNKEDIFNKPILLHIKTQKGKGFESPQNCEESYHAVSKFDVESKIQQKKSSNAPTYTKVFANTLTQLAKDDRNIVAISAAMPSGTGLNVFAEAHPDRFFDVGIAEQHAVTFAAGLAAEGIKPFVAIYSTFLQRAYDQIVHDVAIQKLAVRFAIDRAGLVGADGATHAGAFDITYLCTLPHFVVMAPSNELELQRAIATSLAINDRPSAFRYPRGEATGISIDYDNPPQPFEIGKGVLVKNAHAPIEKSKASIKKKVGSEQKSMAQSMPQSIAIISLGTRLEDCLAAAKFLEEKYSLAISVMDARFSKPIDKDLICSLAKSHSIILTIEEGSIGGFAAQVNDLLLTMGMLDSGELIIRNMMLPDKFLDHDSQDKMYEVAQLDKAAIIAKIEEIMKSTNPK